MDVSPNSDINEMSLLLKATEVATILRSNVKSVYELKKKGRLPFVQIGRKILFPKQGLIDFIEGKSRVSRSNRR